MADCTQGLTHAQTELANDVIIIDVAVHDATQEQQECLHDIITTDGTATYCRATTIWLLLVTLSDVVATRPIPGTLTTNTTL